MWKRRGEETTDIEYEVTVLSRDSGARKGRGCLVTTFENYSDGAALPLPT